MNKQVKNILLRLFLLLGLASVLLLMVFAKLNRERTPVKGIAVEINELNDAYLVRQEDVKKLVTGHFHFQDRMMTGAALRKIEQLIENIPQVSDASAFVDDNSILRVEVEQRVPVARVYAISGESYYVDEAGFKFPLSPVNTVKVPVITGNIREEGKKVEPIRTQNLENAVSVQKKLQNNTLWRSMIGQIHVNEKNEIELVPRLGQAIVLLGSPDGMDEKMKKLEVFFAEVIGKEGWDKYKVINIMYKDQVVCLK
jgi:cell division protein FtsQ